MAITYLGEVTGNPSSLASLAIDFSGLSPQAGDVAVVGYHAVSNADRTIGITTSGYTEVVEGWANDSNDANYSVNYKVLGSGETSVTVEFTGAGSSTHAGNAFVRLYRGVDNTTPLDITFVAGTHNVNILNSKVANPPAITPVTSGALIIAMGFGAGPSGHTATYASSDLTDFTSSLVAFGSFTALNGVGHKAWTSGAFDAAAFTGADTDATCSVGNVVIALRPAAGGGPTYTLALGHGTYSLSGQALGMKANRVLSLGAGSFALAGQDMGLRVSRRLSLGQGSYVLSGQALGVLAQRKLILGHGSYVLVGQDLTLTKSGGGGPTYTLTLGHGTYTLSGQPLGMKAARKIVLQAGVYALTGNGLGLVAQRRLSLGHGSYVLSGRPLGLIVSRRLALGTGIYSLSGQPIALKVARRIALEAGVYALSGQDMTLTYSGATIYRRAAFASTSLTGGALAGPNGGTF